MAKLSLERKFHSFAQTEQFYDLCVRAARLGIPELYRAASTISLFRRTEDSCTADEILDAYNAVRQGLLEGDESKILKEGASEDEKTFLLLAYRHAMIWGNSKSDAYQWELYYEKPGAVYWTLFECVVNAEKAGASADGYDWLVNATGLRDAIDLGATDVVELYSRCGFRSFPLSKVVLDAMLKSREIFEAIRPLLKDAEISFEKDDFDPRKVAESLLVRPVGELRELVALVDGHSSCPGTFLKIGAKQGVLASTVPDLSRLKVLLELGMECNPENCLSFDYDASPPSALYRAVEEDSLEAVKLLLGHGADPDSGSCGWSVCAAALNGRNLDVLKALVAAGAEIDHNCNWKGKIKSPLRVALDNGDYDLVRKLIALGADPSLTPLGEVVYQKAVRVEDIPADLRPLFEDGAGRSVPRGKYCGEGEYRNPYIGRMPECVFWQCEYDGWISWGDGNVGLAWARKLYLAAEAGGKLPRWLVECAQPVQEKILALWIYVNYCNRHVWPEGLATTWSSRYIVAKHHDFWHEVPPCARAIDWTSYWTLCPPKPQIKVVVGDMASIEVDAIVNATGEGLIGTGGLSGALFKAAGPALEKECLKFPADGKGVRCPVGEIRVTGAGKLPAKCVIHTVGPTFKGGSWGEPSALENCYRKSLEHVVSAGFKSIAFPCISTGKHGYPFDQSARIAVNTVRNFLKFHNEIEVIFCIYNDPETSKEQKAVYDKIIDEIDALYVGYVNSPLKLDNDMPVGNRIIEKLDRNHCESSPTYKSEDQAGICTLIDDAINQIHRFRVQNGFSKDLKQQALVVGLFKTFDEVDDNQRLRLTAQCSEEFLNWCKKEILRGDYAVCRLLLNFAYDTSHIGYLGKAFNSGYARRSHFWIPRDSFKQVFNWFCKGIVPERLTSEFLCIFELRQAMEVAFHGVIGLGDVSVPLRIPHEIIPDILHKNLTAQNFSPGEGLTIKDFMHIYEWTDRSIHLMCTDWVWVVWKAMMIGCEFFACPAIMGDANVSVSIYDNFRLSVELLKKVRSDFVTGVKRRNKMFKEFRIEWKQPKAAIVDNEGRPITIPAETEVVHNDADSPQ